MERHWSMENGKKKSTAKRHIGQYKMAYYKITLENIYT